MGMEKFVLEISSGFNSKFVPLNFGPHFTWSRLYV